MLRIVYCGADFYANCLELLLDRQDVQVIKVFVGASERGNQSKEVVKLAKEHDVPYVFDPISEHDITSLFSEQGCDYILSAAYPTLIPNGSYRGINLHPTLLPVGRGAWPFPKLILDDYKESGVTLHKLSDRFDAGDIVLQKRFLLDENETLDTLIEKCKMLGPELIREWLDHSETLWDAAKPQGKGEYWKRLPSEAWTINFYRTPKEIDRTIRAFGSYGVIIKHGKRKWISTETVCREKTHTYEPGKILKATDNMLQIAANGGMLYATRVKEIRPPTLWKRIRRKLRSILSKTKQKLQNKA